VRVVFLTHNYPRHAGDLPGIFLHTLARGLLALGHDVRVVAPSDRGRGGTDAVEGIPVRRVRYATPARERYAYTGAMASALRSPGGLQALHGLWRALRAGARQEVGSGKAPAVVHAHWWIPAGLAAPPECPLVVTVHGTDARLLQRAAAARIAARTVFGRSRVVTAVSTAAAAVVSRAMPAGREARVQPMPVDTEGWGWSRGGGGALLVGRLTAQKRVQLALEAMARLQREGQGLALTIVGDGPERPALEERARHLGLSGVRFLGTQPVDGVRALLEEADVALQLSVREGFGLAAAEAIMCGVPVVGCADGGGLLDVVPAAGAGRVVGPNPRAIAAALGELQSDPEARAAARKQGEALRRDLAPRAVAERFAGWYAEAVHG